MNVRWASRLAAAGLGIAALGGCGDGGQNIRADAASADVTGDDVASNGDALVERQLTLGTGFSAYTPIEDGETLMFLLGPQGGFHIWGAIEASGVAPGLAQIDFFLDYQGQVIAQAFYADELGEANNDGLLSYSGVAVAVTQNFQDRMRIPPEILGLDPRLANNEDADFEEGDMLLRVELTDAAGIQLTDERAVTTACCVN
ncbi:MAG: hypothetical protein ACI81R_003591 [Bradymonadia bacterium]|jgi:hypothetical protein